MITLRMMFENGKVKEGQRYLGVHGQWTNRIMSITTAGNDGFVLSSTDPYWMRQYIEVSGKECTLLERCRHYTYAYVMRQESPDSFVLLRGRGV